jgi:hypothetical protein
MPNDKNDLRNLANGSVIPSSSYADQPYVAILGDASWLCVMTTGAGEEGEHGQHVVAIRSFDQGETWSRPVAIEPPDGPEASWATPLHVADQGGPLGRVYAFYVYNRDNLREVIADDDWARRRVDTLGYFVFRYSDDGGETWSPERYEVPVRAFEIDRENPYGGEVRFFWSVCKPLVADGRVYIGLHKVGRFGDGFMSRSEGCFVASDDLLRVADPAEATWTTLPDGEIGLRAVAGPIADEQNITALSDGTLFCTYRTIDGHPCHAYSSDGGHTWTPPAHMTYGPGGRKVKHPRAANFVRRFSNGKFLYWFHNHGDPWYDGRNPVWLLGGREVDTPEGRRIAWSEPEIALYDDDVASRVSYPDFIEQDGAVFVTETQKTIARVHRLDPAVLAQLWREPGTGAVAPEGLVFDALADAPLPRLPRLWRDCGGISIDFAVRFDSLRPHQLLFGTRDERGVGIAIRLTDRGTLRAELCGVLWNRNTHMHGMGLADCAWETDLDLLSVGRASRATIILDGGPRTITWVVDGHLCDGGAHRTYGWGRLHRNLDDLNAAPIARLAPDLDGELLACRIYSRALKTNEAVGNHRAE